MYIYIYIVVFPRDSRGRAPSGACRQPPFAGAFEMGEREGGKKGRGQEKQSLPHIMSCHAVSCHAVSCYDMLCYVMLCCLMYAVHVIICEMCYGMYVIHGACVTCYMCCLCYT